MKNWKPKLTEEDQHLCMENTKWDTENLIMDYLTMTTYNRMENGDIDLKAQQNHMSGYKI